MKSAPILVTGFGPFLDVQDNPSGALALAVDGLFVADVPLVGRVLPVSFARAPEQTARWVRELGARAVIGTGVAVGRPEVQVESTGRRACGERRDVDGVVLSQLGEGPESASSTLDPIALARALGATVSDSAGDYVCNAWLYQVVQRVSVPAVFVHLPATGLAPERLIAALRRLFEDGLIGTSGRE